MNTATGVWKEQLIRTPAGTAKLLMAVSRPSLRVASNKGEPGEGVALTVMQLIHEHAEMMDVRHRTYERHHCPDRGKRTYHVDAIDFYGYEDLLKVLAGMDYFQKSVVH